MAACIQFLVVDRYYVETLGLDPQDPDWIALGFDWARGRERQPEYVAARARLYGKLIAQLPRETAETTELLQRPRSGS